MAENPTSIESIFLKLSSHEGFARQFTFTEAMRFVRLTSAIRKDIIHAQGPDYDPSSPPSKLPSSIKEFLQGAVGLDQESVGACWDAFKETIWTYTESEHSAAADARAFHAFSEKLGLRSLYPPLTHCINPDCIAQDKLLRAGDKSRHQIIFYTLGDGACATYHYQMSCLGCPAVYHHNYYVLDNVRTYYRGVPDIIEIGKHHFVEKGVAEMLLNLMLIACSSATNGAEIYNLSLSKKENQPEDWDFVFDLRPEHVWHAISHLAILEQWERDGRVLTVRNDEDQKDRLGEAIRERNKLFADHSQPEWGHYCTKCVHFYTNELLYQ